MKTNVTEYDFCRAFETSDSRKDTFTHSAQKALYDYLVQYEEDTGEEVELDIVALCCDYTEYASALECVEEYNPEYAKNVLAEEEDEEEREKLAIEWLEDRTQVIPFDGTMKLHDGTVLGNKGIIIAQF